MKFGDFTSDVLLLTIGIGSSSNAYIGHYLKFLPGVEIERRTTNSQLPK
ncbi:MAG: hypothetical protein KME38_30635 [Spirirestis rafaelensis WJT71-NPBG6]|nr:hypothetical protein [Spirirestis rafaelensis WJT71-NPBG6]